MGATASAWGPPSAARPAALRPLRPLRPRRRLPGAPLLWRGGAAFLEGGRPLTLAGPPWPTHGSLLGLVLARGGRDGLREAEGGLRILDGIPLALRDVRTLLEKGCPPRSSLLDSEAPSFVLS